MHLMETDLIKCLFKKAKFGESWILIGYLMLFLSISVLGLVIYIIVISTEWILVDSMTVVMALGMERTVNSMPSLSLKWDPVTKHFTLETGILPLNCISVDDVHSEQSWSDSCVYSAFLSFKLIPQFSISYYGTFSIYGSLVIKTCQQVLWYYQDAWVVLARVNGIQKPSMNSYKHLGREASCSSEFPFTLITGSAVFPKWLTWVFPPCPNTFLTSHSRCRRRGTK